MVLILILAVGLLGISVVFVVSAILEPRLRRSENLSQIDAYGYLGRLPDVATPTRQRGAQQSIDALAGRVGEFVGRRILNVKEDAVQHELVSAGFYRVGARRFVGYRVLLSIAVPLVLIWLFALIGQSSPTILILTGVFGWAFGWMGPNFYLHRMARLRLTSIDEALPALIDLLVVTLEAGVAFTQAMRMSAERLSGALGDEVRLTIQEQTLGLSTLEALESWLRRCDTPSVRSFVRAMVQGDKLGVSIGAILRNQAFEMRARQKAVIEEKAQKAPIKILFPLILFIFPAMFVIILGPAMFKIMDNLHS